MKKLVITWGQDTPCYATSTIDVPDDATTEQMIDAARSHANEVNENLVFDPSFDFSGLRIVDISEANGGTVACEIAIEPCGEDLGLVCENVIKGRVGPMAIVFEAERQGIAIDADMRDGLIALQATAALKREFEIPNFDPFELVIDAFACGEFNESPMYARIMVTPETLTDWVRIGANCKHAGIRAAHIEDDDGIWRDDDDEFRMRGTDLVLMPSFGATGNLSFFFMGHPKHSGEDIETRAIELRRLIACIGQTDNLPAGFKRVDGVLFYDGGAGSMDFIVQSYTGEDPLDDVAF
jgi:hypothetical protein